MHILTRTAVERPPHRPFSQLNTGFHFLVYV